MEKEKIRQAMKERLDDLNSDLVESKGKFFCKSFLEKYGDMDSFFVYVSKGKELSTYDLIDELVVLGKIVCVPRWNKEGMIACQIFGWNDLIENNYGVLVPRFPSEYLGQLDVVVIPGLAFDKNGNRIGRGGGYYDSRLSDRKKFITSVGVGYGFQCLERIPVEEHDFPLDQILTFQSFVDSLCRFVTFSRIDHSQCW